MSNKRKGRKKQNDYYDKYSNEDDDEQNEYDHNKMETLRPIIISRPQPHLEPPRNFSFIPAEWTKWKSRFERYRLASGLSEESEDKQMAEHNPSRQELINAIKEHLVLHSTSVVGPTYHALNKKLANLYFEINEELKGIYHLTEAHAATLREQTVIKYDYKEDQITNPPKSADGVRLPVAQGIQKKYVDFRGEIALQAEQGLLSRLREMPKEWTVVQLTRQYDSHTLYHMRPRESVTSLSALHVTQLPCGAALETSIPVSILVSPPEETEGMPTLFNLMDQAIKEKLRTKKTRPKEIRKAREIASQNIKDVVVELSSRYLKEWRCLLLGRFCSILNTEQVKDCIDLVLNDAKHASYKMDGQSRQLLNSVAEAAVHLTPQEIQRAVCCLVSCENLAVDLINAIETLKENMPSLVVARRHPVILILDEELDSLPWELLPILKRHPVSRVPSIHFLHALYHEHKDFIVDGCRLVDQLDVGFYIVNPDEDLKEMESRLVSFLEKRMPKWKGIKGTNPSQEEFCQALVDNNVFLYCGHFNGTQFLKQDNISSLRVVALPLLFGCSSIALQQLGGRAQPTSVSDRYMMAGSPCVLGMLWTVTSDDTDCMTVMLLNSWLPGSPIDLTSFRSAGDMLRTHKEPELLRLLRHARETALLFSNSAALVARGIPVRMKQEGDMIE